LCVTSNTSGLGGREVVEELHAPQLLPLVGSGMKFKDRVGLKSGTEGRC